MRLVVSHTPAKRFAVSGSVVRVPGWRALYGAEAEADADIVPGRAKRDDEATVARLLAVQDGEEAGATGAEGAAAVTEPPRRITRGELPVVTGRLYDQVADPALKRALENPADPNVPKGLGTAATRDTVPKLVKSRHVTKQKGRDRRSRPIAFGKSDRRSDQPGRVESGCRAMRV